MGLKSAQQIWETALGELQLQVSKQNYRTWLEKTVGLSYEDNTIIIGAPNTFTTEYLDKKLRSLVEKTLIGLTAADIKLVFQVNNCHQGLPENDGAHTKADATITSRRAMFNERYTFDSFVAGNCNQLARSAALAVAENPGQQYNPLFIYGGVGLGKTHLLQAIGLAALARHRNVLFVSAEKYTNEFVTALREGKTKDFHSKYRNVDTTNCITPTGRLSSPATRHPSHCRYFRNACALVLKADWWPPLSPPILKHAGLFCTIRRNFRG